MVCVFPLAQTVNRTVGCSPFRQLIAPVPLFWNGAALGKQRMTAFRRFSINPAYFVANARSGNIKGTHSCSAEQGNLVRIQDTADLIRGAVCTKLLLFLRKRVIGSNPEKAR